MIKKLVFGIAVVALAICAGTVMAGDYHSGATLVCAECHTMHYSISHDFGDGHKGDTTITDTVGPHSRLLKAEPNDLCKQCHDGQTFAPDVWGANTGTHVREAGALTTNASPYEDWKGHTLGFTGTAPGGTVALTGVGLECITCHGQHGGGATQWRNLWSKPHLPDGTSPGATAYVTYAVGTNDTTKDIFEHDATLGQVATHYSIANVDFNEPDATKSAYAAWCKNCHTNFHGAVGDANMGSSEAFVRHPAGGINIGFSTSGAPVSTYESSLSQYTGRTNKVKVLVNTAANDFTPSCFSCHKAHGNQNAFGLIHMQNTGTVTEQGVDGASAKHLCRQCHAQGSDT